MKALAKKLLRRETRLRLRYAWMKACYLFDFGQSVHCPICGRTCSKFAAFNQRPNALCPRCFSLERHRLLYLYLKNRTEVFARPQRILHFAPEKCLAVKLREYQKANYVTADTMDQFISLIEVKPDRVMSVTDIKDADQTYDVVICSHVLEHVPDDRRALGEIYRVLKPGGVALILVPINSGATETLEDFSLDEAERRRQYGSPHHVRYYAEPDLLKRMASSGFSVTRDNYVESLEGVKRFVLSPADMIYVGRK